MIDFVAAAAQFAPSLIDIRANLDKACHMMEQARREHHADLIVFPETITTGFSPGMSRMEFWDILDSVPGKSTDIIARTARSLGLHVNLPLYERGETRGTIYNSSVLIDDTGDISAIYRKTHLFPNERLENGGWTTPGNKAITARTRLGTFGLIICYDGDFPELSRVLAINGAEIILRPSALLRSCHIWELTSMARAYDNHVYMIACNAIGPDAAGNCFFGNSMIISPDAHKLTQARGTEEIVSARLDPEPVRYITTGSRAPLLFDHIRDRNMEVYQDIMREADSPFHRARKTGTKQ